ncbi:PASTA domain-containing protein [Paenibacillus sedimenti]|uniref:PASTA domain-containing protein n=1 Tax=Paenibacillus sedimenti TaxID=2770274 RepID=A0A926KL19_9BACL|nr:PASTA domain-containing protein [Paenibacillus sedimenti]MBD0378946.1 PASTA domain-containing protein [Paenibacillus sedimenti]
MDRLDRRIGNRYVSNSLITTLHNGVLHNGEDLYLNRKIVIYSTELEEGQSADTYLHKFKRTSSFNHDGFLHILDTSFKDRTLLIILQQKPGHLLAEQLRSRLWTFDQIISLVTDLGVSMLDSMEEQVTGFSVSLENLWYGENGRISVINYWDEGAPQTQGVRGLCGLLVQLLSGKTEMVNPFEAMHTHLERIQIPSATMEQKDALIKLVKPASQGQASLSTLIFGLRKLQSISVIDEEQPPLPSRSPIQNEPVPKLRFYKRKSVGAAAFFVAAIFVIWILWPSFSKSDRQVSVTPSQSVKPAAVMPTPSPSPEQATSSPKGSVTDKEQNKEVIIPNLVGMVLADAEKQALADGLRYKYFLEAGTAPKGTVTKQDPAAGTKGMQGDTVTFWVSKGSQ